ncbi:MAG TPA: rod shape-determining protein MreC [Thermodesulfobacteriota bacterium]|nr:rod shape-determining protein MreC [Thermodesulfobacteriota bacterium]
MTSFVKKHRVVIVSVLLCLFSLYLVSTPRSGTGGEIIVRKVVLFFAVPLELSVNAVQKTAKDAWNGYIFLVNVKKENDELKNSLNSLAEENNKLREELALKTRIETLEDFGAGLRLKSVVAGVVSVSGLGGSSGWTRTLVINKGENYGIQADMPVISPAGVVGRIINTGETTSTVLLLTDPRSNINAVAQRTRLRGIAEGTSDGITLKYINRPADIAAGDVILTAGLADIFPKGTPIGTVVSVEDSKDTFFKDVRLKPAADIGNLEEVLVIAAAPGAPAPPEETKKKAKLR